MGGQQIASVGKVIQVQTSYLQFPLAAANAVVLLAVVVLMIIVALNRLVDLRKENTSASVTARLLARAQALLAVRAASAGQPAVTLPPPAPGDAPGWQGLAPALQHWLSASPKR